MIIDEETKKRFKKSQNLFKTIASLDLFNCFALRYYKRTEWKWKTSDVTYFKDGNRLGKRKAFRLGLSFKKKFMEHDFSEDKERHILDLNTQKEDK